MERDSVRRSFAWTKLGVRSQGNGKVGSIGSGVVQFGKVVGIQFDSDFILFCGAFCPGLLNVVILFDIAELKQQLPQLLQRLFL